MSKYWAVMETPVGRLLLEASDDVLTLIEFGGRAPKGEPHLNLVLREAVRQLSEYFSGTRTDFDLPLDLQGTEFQRKVWQRLCAIPYARTKSYGQVAASLKKPLASRAVGMACARNPLPIVVPCHRVVGSNGNLTGFGGGIGIKEWLLRHELSHAS